MIDLPQGAPNCLAGLKFVFTGVLDTLDRESGKSLVKQYGGICQSAPSSKTNYVVLGSDAGLAKLNAIKQHKLKTLDEKGLFDLITTSPENGGNGAAAQLAKAKAEKDEAAAIKQARKMEEEDRKQQAKAKAASMKTDGGLSIRPHSQVVGNANKLWTVKYAPTALDQIVGNKPNVKRICDWLRDYQKSAKLKFKLPGREGLGAYRSIIIHGPPGIGKTTAAHLAARIEGYDIVESNASDTRSKKLIEDGLKGVLSTTSLLGYFSGDGKEVDQSKKKIVIIMDEVDGMSAGDRGGVGAMAAICRKTEVPIILICNDRKLPKMKPFDGVALDMPFRKPTADQIKSRIMTIAYREKLKIPAPVLTALIEGSNADIRQIINMLSTIKLDEANLNFEDAQSMSKAWEKHAILKPWDISNKILGSSMFHSSSKASLNDKIELYFNDHEFSPLMVQENYLKTSPLLANDITGSAKQLKLLELVDKASYSISDGDLVDRMIHGTQQHWSLMPTHAISSFVRPASFMYGNLGYQSTSFTTWLGNNSKQGKLTRFIKEIQGHMRLRCSADRYDVRENYIPMFWRKLPKRLAVEGKNAIKDIINLMDSYYLTKDDFDAVLELGLGEMSEANAKADTQTKTAFSRTYNQMSHPLPFMKASSVTAPKVAKERPDLEEAIEESDEGEVIDAKVDREEEDEGDITKDKYIAAPKKKPASKARKRLADEEINVPAKKGKTGRRKK